MMSKEIRWCAHGYGFARSNSAISHARVATGIVFRQHAVFVSLYTVVTWCEKLGNFRFRIRYNSESVRGMVAGAAFRTFVVDGDDDRHFPYLNQNGTRWYMNWNWIGNDFNRNERVAVSGN